MVTAILFVLVQSALLSFGQFSEQIEAVVSVLAIGVLLLVMNWFFHKVYWTRWIAKHHEQRRRLLIGGVAGQALGFALLGFTSVFREGRGDRPLPAGAGAGRGNLDRGAGGSAGAGWRPPSSAC